MCKHDIIDNGTRISECRKCKRKAVLKDLEWVIEESNIFTGAKATIYVDGKPIGFFENVTIYPNDIHVTKKAKVFLQNADKGYVTSKGVQNG